MLPSAVKSVPYARVKDIEFSKVKSSLSPTSKPSTVTEPSKTELSDFFNCIKNCSSKPAVLSLIPEHSDSFVPKSLNPEFPFVLSSLYDESLSNENFSTVLEKAKEKATSFVITKQQQELVEEKTKDQANSRLWFRMRTGRITASQFKNACRTDPAFPSHSLIMSICYPELTRFSTEATRWGCQHEWTARETYGSFQKGRHKNFEITDSGFFISTQYPYLGASPDGIVNCEYCGAGACEIKLIIFFKTYIMYNKIYIINFKLFIYFLLFLILILVFVAIKSI